MTETTDLQDDARRRPILDSLPSQSRTTGEQAIRRSRLVRRLRLAFPVLALVLVAAFVFNTQTRTVDEAFLDDFKQVAASTEDLRMANPRFAGVDDKGQPFEITANAAIQDPERRDMVELENPRAVQGKNEDETVVTAMKGIYRSEENILELSNEVTLEHDIANTTYVFRSPSATVMIENEVVESDSGVGGESTSGDALRADRMRAYKDEGRVVFEGNVSMRYLPKARKNNSNSNAPALKDVELVEPQ